MLKKSQLRWIWYVSRMENHRLLRIILGDKLSIDHRSKKAPKKWLKDCPKKNPLLPVISTIAWRSPLPKTEKPCVLPLTALSHPLKTPVGMLPQTKSARRGSTILYHQVVTGPLAAAAATVPDSYVSAIPVMNVPVVGVDGPLLDFHFEKLSQQWMSLKKAEIYFFSF